MDSELERVVAGARARLEQLESRYPRLRAWLVLAQRQHQVDVFADPRHREYVASDLPRILTTFPGVFELGVHRRAAEPLAQRILEADRNWGDLTAAERRWIPGSNTPGNVVKNRGRSEAMYSRWRGAANTST